MQTTLMITVAKFRVALIGLLLLLTLGACVTETNSRSNISIDKEKALELHIKLASGYIQKKNRESARHHLRKAFELDKNSFGAAAAKARLYELEGEPKLAEEQYKQVLRRNKDFTEARNGYGLFLYRAKRYEDAYTEFEQAAADLDYDDRAQVLVNVGRTAFKLGNLERAESAFAHASILNPKLSAPFIELAEIYFEKKEYAEAKRHLDQYAVMKNSSPRSLLLGIRIERIFGNRDKEASYVLQLKNRFPYSKEYLEYKQTMSY